MTYCSSYQSIPITEIIFSFCILLSSQLGDALSRNFQSIGLKEEGMVVTSNHGTAVYTALCQNTGELEMAGVFVYIFKMVNMLDVK